MNENNIRLRISAEQANPIIDDLRNIQWKLHEIDESLLIGLDLADLAEEVRHAIRVLTDRSNLS